MVKNILKKLAPKSVARKPVPRLDTYLKFGFVITEHEVHLCPMCVDILGVGPNYQPGYCGKCGQKVSFSGIRWKEDRELGRKAVMLDEDWRNCRNPDQGKG